MRKRGKIIPFRGRAGGAPSPPAGRPPASDRSLVEVHRCDQAEALVVKSLFDSEGIPVLLRAGQVSSVYPFSVGDQGQVAILVPEAEVVRSRVLLARIASGPSFP